ncbi:SLC23A1 [Mytilus edulis]|uniref:SLC23A1 n=1 Tax=Mytilus edulis TaxID=6550 RepID=A0A8S3QM35_MYTED|nr:SLC23A1 [Mytilus edulis]
MQKHGGYTNKGAEFENSDYNVFTITNDHNNKHSVDNNINHRCEMPASDVTKQTDGIVYKSVNNGNSHVVMSESKFVEKAEEKKVEIDDGNLRRLNYKISESPPIHLALFFAMQNVLLALPWCLSMAILVADFVCAEDDYNFKAMLLSTTLLMSGLTTLVQVTVGIRLPVYQGPTTAYIIPLLALKELPEWSCPEMHSKISTGLNMTFPGNLTTLNGTESTMNYRETVILPRIRVTMGCLALAGFIHMLTGMFGLVGMVMKFVGPITVIPTVLLIGLNAFKVTTKFCQVHWGIAAVTGCTSLILSLYLDGKRMPVPVWTPTRKWHIILISIVIGWTLSAIFTVTNVLPDDKDNAQYLARTDSRSHVITSTPWFYLPYPGQFGPMDFSGGIFMAFFTATLYSITDSIADYHACAKMARVPPPPIHAINRGLMFEGCLSMISGFFGAGHATSTYGGHIGSIGITKVASRLVFGLFPCILILFAIIGKLAAVFITIPYPVLGGVQIIGFGMFIGLVMSNLQYIDIHSTRNLAIIGISTLLGLMLPFWAKGNADAIDTGSPGFDSFIRVVLSNPSLVGGVSACFLDNTVPGTRKERGLLAWGQAATGAADKSVSPDYEEGYEIYEIQSWSARVNNLSFTKYIPFFPMYDIKNLRCTCCKKNTKYEP